MEKTCTDCNKPLVAEKGAYYDEFCYQCGYKRAPKPTPYELYRHYKGGEYMVLSISIHTETKEPMVNYTSLTYGSLWSRPLKIWNENVADPWNGGMSVPRFNKIDRRSK